MEAKKRNYVAMKPIKITDYLSRLWILGCIITILSLQRDFPSF